MIGFFSQRLEQAGSDLSVERVQEVIMKGAQALPTDRLKVNLSHTHADTQRGDRWRARRGEIMKYETV